MSPGPVRMFESDPFPPVTIEIDSGYWSGEVELGGTTLPMSIYIDSAVTDTQLERAARMLEGLVDLRSRGRAAILTAAAADDTIMRDFFQFHLDEVPEALPDTVRAEPSIEGFVGALELVGVAIHSDEERAFQIVLDFSFGRDHSDELLAAKFGPGGSVLQVSHES